MTQELLSSLKVTFRNRVAPLAQPGVPGSSVQDDGWELTDAECREFMYFSLGSTRNLLQSMNVTGRWVRSRRDVKPTKKKAVERINSNILYQLQLSAKAGHPLLGWSEEMQQQLVAKMRGTKQ